MSRSGLDGKDELIAYFHKNVSNPKLVDKFDKVCKQWEGLKAGCVSPSFTAPDINGKMVSLSSLKGKYVKGLTVSFVARNPFIVWKNIPNIDPDSSYNTSGLGLEYGSLPSRKSYGLNVNVKF